MANHTQSDPDDESSAREKRIGRRDYLKSAAATVVAAGGVAGRGSAQESDYETIQATGQTIFVGSGETWENKLIDMSTGDDIAISATGTNWTIRNIGIQGMQTSDIGRTYFGVADTGGNTSTIENVYIGDGTTSGNQQPTGHGTSGIWVDPDHSGHLDIRHVNIQGMADNGIYGSAPGSNDNGQRGTIHIDSSYASNCHVAQFRLADGCTISNSVAFNDGSFQYNGRCFWGWPTKAGNRIEIRDCDFESGSYANAIYLGRAGETTRVYMEGTQYDGMAQEGNVILDDGGGNGSNQDMTIPDGVPTSAQEAASGGSGDSIVGEGHHFHIDGPGEFYLEVDEAVEPDPEYAPWADYGEDYGDDWVSFELTDTGETEWWFVEDVVDLQYTADQTVWIDGEEYDDGGGGDPPEAPVVEDFERSNPLAEYGGETGLFSPTTSTVYEGDRALVNDGGDFGSVVSTNGLNDYPERGDEVHVCFTNAADDNFVAFHLFAQSESDNPDSYTIGISAYDGFTLWKNESGNTDALDSDGLSSSDQISGWYRAEISSDASTVSAELYDDSTDELLASVQADDATYASGGVGFRSAGNGEVWDYAVRDETEDSTVEDFERSTPLDDYGGADGLFGTTGSTVYEGDRALVNDGGDFGSAVSTSGLDRYPDRGDEVHVRFTNAADDNFVAFHLFAQSESDNPDGYTAGISGYGGWKLWKNESGDTDEIATDDLPTSDQISGWYRAEIRTDSTTVYADLYDDATDTLLASVQADDAAYTAGGIGFRSAGNGEVWDYVHR